MSDKGKCTAEGGPANCGRANCPERIEIVDYQIPDVLIHSLAERRSLPTPLGAWTNEDTILFKTVAGSKLYGIAKAASDDDFYIITPTKYTARKINAQQKIEGNDDTTSMDFKSFVTLAGKGVPQTLEAMFSRKSRSDFFEDYRQGYFASDPEVIHTYMKTIKSFSLSDKDPFKRKRHALRLALNLEEILYTGRFNPTLSAGNARRITQFAQKEGSAYFAELKKICPIEVDWDEAQNNDNMKRIK